MPAAPGGLGSIRPSFGNDSASSLKNTPENRISLGEEVFHTDRSLRPLRGSLAWCGRSPWLVGRTVGRTLARTTRTSGPVAGLDRGKAAGLRRDGPAAHFRG
jgi:hypothetical protein